jgi:hypothetical protein
MGTKNEEELDLEQTQNEEQEGAEEKDEEPEQRVIQTDDPENPVRVEQVERPMNRKQRRAAEAEERTNRRVQEAVGPLQRQLAELRQMLQGFGQQPRQPAQQQAADDDEDSEYSQHLEEQNATVRLLMATTDPAERAKLEKKLAKLDRKRIEHVAAKMVESRVKPAEQPSFVQRESEYKRMELGREYPEVFQNERIHLWAVAENQKLRAYNAEMGLPPPTIEDEKKICHNALLHFGVRKDKPSRPSEAQQAKFGPPDSRPGAKGGDSAWIPTAQQRSLAWEYAGGKGVTMEQALLKWRKDIGKPSGIV